MGLHRIGGFGGSSLPNRSQFARADGAISARKVPRRPVLRYFPDWSGEIRKNQTRMGLLMAYARRHAAVREVPDPYYGAAAGFEHVLDLVEDACDGLVARLSAELPASPSASQG